MNRIPKKPPRLLAGQSQRSPEDSDLQWEPASAIRSKRPITEREALWTYSLVGGFVVLLTFGLQTSSWRGSSQLHTAMEVVACTLALLVGVLALVWYYADKRKSHLFIGVGFIGTFLLDGYHAVVTSELLDYLTVAPPESLIPWSWNASRTFLALLLAWSWWTQHRDEKLADSRRVSEVFVYSVVGVLTVATFLFFAFFPLPRAYYPDLLLGRPQELFAAALFLVALVGYVKNQDWQYDRFEHWLVISILIGVVTQTLTMSRSFGLFDAMFDLAHVLKIATYVCVLVGLLHSVHQTYVNTQSTAQQTKQVLDGSPCGMLIVRSDGMIRFANSTVCESLGYTTEEIVGQPVEVLVPEHVRAKHSGLRDGFFWHQENRTMISGRELHAVRKDGSLLPVEISLSPVEFPEGICVVASILDISERKKAAAEVKEHETVLAAFVDNTQDYAMLMLDAAGNIATWNRGAQRIKGYQQEEIIGKHFSSFYPKEALARGWPEHELEVASREGRFEDEGWRVRKDGSQFWANVVITTHYDVDGQVTGFANVTRDLTERKRQEDELRRTAEQLQSANDDLEGFTYIASHDLQEPLRNVLSYVSLLKQDVGEDLTEDAREDLEFISSAAKRMQRLLEDLLAFSRAGRQEINTKVLPLDECVDEATSALQTFISDTSARIERSPLPQVSVDPSLVAQLFQNLIGNAMKFTKDKDVSPVVEITAEENGVWVFGVKDNGIGIKSEYAEQIFSPFKRLHGMTEYEGSGIGLSICKKVVEHHGGSIWVESTPGQGSHFKFTLESQSGGTVCSNN